MTIAAYWPTGSSTRSAKTKTSRRPDPVVQVSALPTDDVWAKQSVPAWVSEALDGIARATCLESGWDGADGAPTSWQAAVMAVRVLVETMAVDSIPPQVVPTVDGGLQLEWHCAGVDLEVYIESDGQVSAWCQEGVREWEEERYPRAKLGKELGLLTRAYCD